MSSKKSIASRVAAGVIATVCFLVLPTQMTLAQRYLTEKTSLSYFAPEALMSADGRNVAAQGTAICGPGGGEFVVAVSMLQQETLAFARGFSDILTCTEGPNGFTAELAVPEGRQMFAPGPATACAFVQSRLADGTPDADFWCVFVTLTVE